MSFLLNPYVSGASPSELAVWDAGLLACYTGSGQTFAEKNGLTDYDLWLGGDGSSESTDPHFVGVAGTDSTAEYFYSDGTGGGGSGDLFRQKSSTGTAFQQAMCMTDAAFTFYFMGRTAGQTSWGIIGTDQVKPGVGFNVSTGLLELNVSNASTDYRVAISSSLTVSTLEETMLAVSYNETTGAGLFYKKTSAGVKTTESFSKRYSAIPMTPVATPQGGRLTIGVTQTQSGLGTWRLRRAGLIQGAATEAQLDALWDAYHARKLA